MGLMREGDVVGDRYRLGAPLGRGAMGQVFRAHDDRLDRQVAVKVVDLGLATDPDIADRFHREAIATARLNHPNIVTIFDADTEGQTAYLVMELLPGRPLSQVIREHGPLPVADAVRIAGEVARALVATHRIGVVHRDIKPANIMIDRTTVKLLDFGIAQISLDASANLTRPATTLGTAAYMSPEQARGERATAASDVYALGGVLMAMLTGQPAFPGDNAVAVLHRQINDPVPWVRQRRREVPDTVDDLVHRMLAKNPAARPGTSEVVTALAHLARNLHEGPRPVAAPGAASPRATAVLPAGSMTSVTRTSPVSPPPPSVPPDGDDNRGFRRAAAWLGAIIVALLVFAIMWAIGSTVLGGGAVTPGTGPTGTTTQSADPTPTDPTTEPTTTAPRTSTPTIVPIPLPTISLPTIPSVGDMGLSAAVRGVGLALDTIDASRSDAARDAQINLREEWAQVSENITADPSSAGGDVSDFREAVTRHADDGDLTMLESQAILLAVGAVEAAL